MKLWKRFFSNDPKPTASPLLAPLPDSSPFDTAPTSSPTRESAQPRLGTRGLMDTLRAAMDDNGFSVCLRCCCRYVHYCRRQMFTERQRLAALIVILMTGVYGSVAAGSDADWLLYGAAAGKSATSTNITCGMADVSRCSGMCVWRICFGRLVTQTILWCTSNATDGCTSVGPIIAAP
jgi:hypothetical protein